MTLINNDAFSNCLYIGNIFNVFQMSSTLFLNFLQWFGIKNVVIKTVHYTVYYFIYSIFNCFEVDETKGIKKFLTQVISEGEIDKEGSMADRYLAEIDENEKIGKSEATFFGERGRLQMYGGFYDLFVAGKEKT